MRHSRIALAAVACFVSISGLTIGATKPLRPARAASYPATQPAAAAPQPAQTSDFADANPYPQPIGLGYSDFGPITDTGAGFGPYPSGIYIGPVWAAGYRHCWHAPSNTVWDGSYAAGVANSINGVPLGPLNLPSIAGGGGTRPAALSGIATRPLRATHPTPAHSSRHTPARVTTAAPAKH